MAQAKTSHSTQAFAFEPETLAQHQHLRRALLDPEVLDEFLVNPKDVAKRYDVELNDEDVKAIRNASQFMAGWEFFCGDGQWLQSVRELDGAPSGPGFSAPDAAIRHMRGRIGEEILKDMPRAIREVVQECGSEVLINPQQRVEELPNHLRPLARALRQMVQTITREVTRELSHVLLQNAVSQQQGIRTVPVPVPTYGFQQPTSSTQPTQYGAVQPTQGVQPSPEVPQPSAPAPQTGQGGNGITLGHQLSDVIAHATQVAMEHVRPQVGMESRYRPMSKGMASKDVT